MNYYQQIVEEFGETYAKEYMKELRSRVKGKTGFALMDSKKLKEVSQSGVKARWKNVGKKS